MNNQAEFENEIIEASHCVRRAKNILEHKDQYGDDPAHLTRLRMVKQILKYMDHLVQ